MTSEDRQRVRQLVDQAKRAEIVAAHGRALNPTITKLSECEECGAVIGGNHHGTRRFCDQACLNAARGHRVRP